MDKNVAGLIGALTALSAAAPSHAATSRPLTIEVAMQASSYADLLTPIPNAAALLEASANAEPTIAAGPAGAGVVQDVQYHHHHHHHRRRPRPRPHHHHHHHHHNYPGSV